MPECMTLFKAMDVDRSESITMDELWLELKQINCALVLDSIKKTSNVGSKDAKNKRTMKEFINVYDNDNDGQIDVVEFAEMVNTATEKTDPEEIDLLFKTIDKQAKGYITSDDLQKAFDDANQVFIKKVLIQPSDILLPLATKTKSRLTRTTQQLFDHFKGDDNYV